MRIGLVLLILLLASPAAAGSWRQCNGVALNSIQEVNQKLSSVIGGGCVEYTFQSSDSTHQSETFALPHGGTVVVDPTGSPVMQLRRVVGSCTAGNCIAVNGAASSSYSVRKGDYRLDVTTQCSSGTCVVEIRSGLE